MGWFWRVRRKGDVEKWWFIGVRRGVGYCKEEGCWKLLDPSGMWRPDFKGAIAHGTRHLRHPAAGHLG